MPFDVRVEAHVAKSREEVAGYMFDPRNDPEWITGIERVDHQPIVSRQIKRSLEADLRHLRGQLEAN